MPLPDGLNIHLELRNNVGRGRSSKRRGCRILGDKQHPIGRVNLERNTQALQHARLRRGALASRKFNQIGRREYQLLFSITNSSFVGGEPGNSRRYEVALLEKGNSGPVAGQLRFPARDTFAPDGAKGSVIARVARERKRPSVLAN